MCDFSTARDDATEALRISLCHRESFVVESLKKSLIEGLYREELRL